MIIITVLGVLGFKTPVNSIPSPQGIKTEYLYKVYLVFKFKKLQNNFNSEKMSPQDITTEYLYKRF